MSLSRQEMFNRIVHHLFNQGTRAVDELWNDCKYRGSDNTKCAVGCLIQDSEYLETMEGSDIYRLIERFGNRFENFQAEDSEFLRYAQIIHDNKNNWISEREMKSELIRFANQYGLDYAFVMDHKLKFSTDKDARK